MSRRSTLSTKPPPGHAYACGRQAGAAGRGRKTNPHRRGTAGHSQWDAGWLEGDRLLGDIWAKNYRRRGS